MASPIRANSDVVRYGSLLSSGKYSIARHGLNPMGTAWALAAKVKRLLRRRSEFDLDRAIWSIPGREHEDAAAASHSAGTPRRCLAA
jgi:hypothetical protein